jgi:hypothetical protein
MYDSIEFNKFIGHLAQCNRACDKHKFTDPHSNIFIVTDKRPGGSMKNSLIDCPGHLKNYHH